MEEASKEARNGGLSDLPDTILLQILSKLRNRKQVVKTSILSTRWRYLWKSVPVSLDFNCPDGFTGKSIIGFIAASHRELHYWRTSSSSIRNFNIKIPKYKATYVKDVDMWVHFATKVDIVESFKLELLANDNPGYKFPQFGYKIENNSLRNLVLCGCKLNPKGSSVNWSCLVSLTIGDMKLKDGVFEKILSGCVNLETLKLDKCRDFHCLEISSVKLKKLIINMYKNEDIGCFLDISAPHIQHLQLLGSCQELRFEDVASLVTANLDMSFDFADEEFELDEEEELRYLYELLNSVANVEKLELGPWCFEDLWSRYTTYKNKEEKNKTKTLYSPYKASLLHLKTIKIINFRGSLSRNTFVLLLVKWLLKSAVVLEKFVISAKFEGCDGSRDYVKMAEEFLSFPRSSPHASVVFSYR